MVGSKGAATPLLRSIDEGLMGGAQLVGGGIRLSSTQAGSPSPRLLPPRQLGPLSKGPLPVPDFFFTPADEPRCFFFLPLSLHPPDRARKRAPAGRMSTTASLPLCNVLFFVVLFICAVCSVCVCVLVVVVGCARRRGSTFFLLAVFTSVLTFALSHGRDQRRNRTSRRRRVHTAQRTRIVFHHPSTHSFSFHF